MGWFTSDFMHLKHLQKLKRATEIRKTFFTYNAYKTNELKPKKSKEKHLIFNNTDCLRSVLRQNI